jgi:hypothetical protein
VLIGTDEPHFGLQVKIGTANTAAARLTWRRVSSFSGGGTSMSVASVFVDIHDGTDTTPATESTPFAQDGRLVIKPTSASLNNWVSEAVQLNGDTESRTKYWSRIGLN